ncbi:hypothetical protein [Streptosporangium sandarakinum]|uniref:hypothetical protein n=1 Tax=Streptosporangium sandarakinum TaxID=1260955 RepID=UPI0037AB9BBE
MIAAAVADLLDHAPPAELDLARYAHRAAEAQKHAGQGHPSTHAPVHQPVSFYLPPPLAARYEQLRRAALDHVHELLRSLRKQAHDRYPGADQKPDRTLWVTGRFTRLGLPTMPTRAPWITGGVIARMAIDRAGRRSVDHVIRAAVDYAAATHDQPHRARRDMHRLTP